jgi:hypothetical protein
LKCDVTELAEIPLRRTGIIMTYDCFISYARLDKQLAEQLSDALGRKGIRCWWDPELRYEVGFYVPHLIRALGESKALVVIVSRNSADRDQVIKEVHHAQEMGKPVIPLFAGEVPKDSPLAYVTQLLQHVKATSGSVEEQVVDEIVSKLRKIVADLTPPVDLKQLNLGEKDMPDFGKLETALQRVGYAHFVSCAKQCNFVEAAQVVEEIRNGQMAMAEERFEAIRSWLWWADWYEKTGRKSKTWSELEKSLTKVRPASVTSVEMLQTVCPPVASELTLGWWRAVDKVFADFLRFLRTKAWAEAPNCLRPLDATLVSALSPLLEGMEILSVPYNSLVSYAEQALACFKNSKQFDELIRAPFPPDEKDFSTSRDRWEQLAVQVESIRQFKELLQRIGTKCGGKQSSAHQCAETIANSEVQVSSRDLPDFDEALRRIRLWEGGLEDLVSEGHDRRVLEQAERTLSEAGNVFVQAKIHARLVQSYRIGASTSDLVWTAKPLPEIIEHLSRYESAVQKLQEELLHPLQGHWSLTCVERAERARKFCEYLESVRKNLQARQRMLEAIAQLVAGNTDGARSVLEDVIRNHPTLAVSVKPWLEVCEAISELSELGSGNLHSLLDPATGLPADVPTPSRAKSQLESILTASERVDNALTAASRNQFLRVEVPIPGRPLIRYFSRLNAVFDSVAMGDWNTAQRSLTAYIGNEAEVPDSAWVLLAALNKLAEAPTVFSLESFLTTAITSTRGKQLAEHALDPSEANKAALFATLGQIESVCSTLKSHSDCIPHNLAVAVFSKMRRDSRPPSSEHLSLLISACALFACSNKYRETVAQSFGPTASSLLSKLVHKLREGFGGLLQNCFMRSGVSWGSRTDPESWACQWEVECFAVNQMSSQESHSPLPWPFGPTLVQFYSLRKELWRVLDRRPTLRLWYGPCAAAVAMNFAAEPESALQSLPRAEACSAEQAKSALGYTSLHDSLAHLQHDINGLRCDILLLLLNRDQFHSYSELDEHTEVMEGIVVHCRELLELRNQGILTDEPFIRALNSVFSRMVDELERPNLHLRGAVTIKDGEARKKCMDGVIDFLMGLPDPEWLANCVRALQSFRSDVERKLVELKVDQWEKMGQPSKLLKEMIELVEDAVRDDPRDPNAKILKARVLLLQGEDSLAESRAYVNSLLESASLLDWSSRSQREVHRLAARIRELGEETSNH